MADDVTSTVTPAASGDTATAAVQTGSTSTVDKTDAASDTASTPQPKRVDPRQRKIAELSYQNRELQRNLDRALSIAERNNAPQARQSDERPPRMEDFGSMSEYLDARDEYREKQRQAKAEPKQKPEADEGRQRYLEHVKVAREDLFAAGSEKYEDFEDMVLSADGISPAMRDAIFEMDDLDMQVEVTRFLAQNQKEARRIYRLSPARQIAEIGKLEAKLSSQPSPKRPSAAPAPISPVGGGKTTTNEISGTEDMKTFIEKRNRQLGRK
jgi:hypothetical protein